MSKRKERSRTPYLNPNFKAGISELTAKLLRSQNLNHTGNKGTAREDGLKDFFSDQLPGKYSIATGEVVDRFGTTSPQLDLMFFDGNKDFCLHSSSVSVLPAEALLASIEVKSTPNATEVRKSVDAAKKLRLLKPLGRELGGTNIGNHNASTVRARYFHGVFAYQSDLKEETWMKNEAARFLGQSHNGDCPIDFVYVLGRGYISLNATRGFPEDNEGNAIGMFFFGILNFLQREGSRRGETPFDRYVKPKKEQWCNP